MPYWERANRMIGAGSVQLAYDGAGNRVRRTDGANVTQYLLDLQPGLAVTLSQTSSANTDRYLHAPRGIHAQKDAPGNWEYAVQDGLGSVRGVADNAMVWSAHYDPFGTGFGASGTEQTSYGFTGEQYDPLTDLLYLRARHYKPGLGQFTAVDPFEGLHQRPMSLNGYGWVDGNVPNSVDPFGLQSVGLGTCLAAVFADGPAPFGDILCGMAIIIGILGTGYGAVQVANQLDPAILAQILPGRYPSYPGIYTPTPESDVYYPNGQEDIFNLPTVTAVPIPEPQRQSQITPTPTPLVDPFVQPTSTCTPTPTATPTPKRCDPQKVLQWMQINPGFPENDPREAFNFQRYYCGLKYVVRGNGEAVVADGIRIEDCRLLDAKFIRDANGSPYVLGSSRRTHLQQKSPRILQSIDNQESGLFSRYGTVLTASETENPFTGLEVITNELESRSYWQQWITLHGVPNAQIVYRPWILE